MIIQTSTLEFLKSIKKNNSKLWMDAHREEYENAKNNFILFLQQVIEKFGTIDTQIQNQVAKETIFRMNRDVRFSKDKSPYKTNFGSSINCAGKKAWNSAGYYIHIEPGNCFVGGGLYTPNAVTLSKLRQEIDYNFESFHKIIKSPQFIKNYTGLQNNKETTVVRMPKGYENTNPAAEYFKFKSFLCIKKYTDNEVTEKSFFNHLIKAFEALYPLILFINQAVQD